MGRIPRQSGGRRLASCAWALILCLFGPASLAAAPDVRVLVGISAGMKASDPDNLRVPAVGALIERLPDGSRAGIWTFGRYVNMLVPWGETGAAWRVAAMEAVEGITSVAVHSDLETALETATWNWTAPDAGSERHLLVITDGPIALPNGNDANARSRGRILDATLPRLRAADATIHAIAVGTSADEDLLRRLAAETGGRYERADAPALPALLGELLRQRIAPPPRRAGGSPVAWPEAPPEPEAAPGEFAAAEPTGRPERDWTRIGLGVMIANLLLGGVLLLAYRFLPRTATGAAAAAPGRGSGTVTEPDAAPDTTETPPADPTEAITGTTAIPDAAVDPGPVAGEAAEMEAETARKDAPAATDMLDDGVDADPVSNPAGSDGEDPPGAMAPGEPRYEALEGIEIEGIDVDRIELDFRDPSLDAGQAEARFGTG